MSVARQKGSKNTPEQNAALAAGRAKRDANTATRRAAKKAGAPMTAKLRTVKLIAGELKVRDLDLEELEKGRCHDGNGSFQGKPPSLPSRTLEQMHAEYIRRVARRLTFSGNKAATRLLEMMDDPEMEGSVQYRAVMAVLERSLGKVPDVVHVAAENEWDRLQQGVFEFDRSELSVTGGIDPVMTESGEEQ